MKTVTDPLPGETADDYVARVDTGEIDDGSITSVLTSHFALDDREAKRVLLDSVAYWQRFIHDDVRSRRDRGASRYGAMRAARNKNVTPGGKRVFSDEALEALIASVGPWVS